MSGPEMVFSLWFGMGGVLIGLYLIPKIYELAISFFRKGKGQENAGND